MYMYPLLVPLQMYENFWGMGVHNALFLNALYFVIGFRYFIVYLHAVWLVCILECVCIQWRKIVSDFMSPV